jgi:hypothetical protein
MVEWTSEFDLLQPRREVRKLGDYSGSGFFWGKCLGMGLYLQSSSRIGSPKRACAKIGGSLHFPIWALNGEAGKSRRILHIGRSNESRQGSLYI